MRRFFRIVLALVVPVVLVVGAVRVVTLPWFPTWAYRRPNFPPDRYGLDLDARLALAQDCIRYLNLPHDLDILSQLHLPDGAVAFNDRELSHMRDVKNVYDQITIWAVFALVVSIIAAWILARRGEGVAIWEALSDGGLITLVSLLALGGLMLTSWDTFFVGLHGVFFAEGTWRFYYTDTLIRLFPEQFWQLAGGWVAGIVVGDAFALALMGRIIHRRLRDSKTVAEDEVSSTPVA
ncbi:MAG: TIGR01906 family membrane protein [Anaerolineae bacterium]|nr:TIGR01906 family membrane protein [Anaerolineae bacterium]